MRKSVLTAIIILAFAGSLFATDLVRENIQDWTNQNNNGNWTQLIPAGTVHMTECRVNNTYNANGAGSMGAVLLKNSQGKLELPQVSSIGIISFHLAANGAGKEISLQKMIGNSWTNLTTFHVNSTGAIYSYTLNANTPTRIRLNNPTATIAVHDIYVQNYGAAINITGTLNPFSTNVGTPSAAQSVSVSGTNLAGNINIASVAGYEYSVNTAGPWSATLSLLPSFNGSVYIRLTGSSAGSYPGMLTFSNTDAATVTLSMTGSVTTSSVQIKITSNIPGTHIYVDGIDSGFKAPHTFTLPAGLHTFGVMNIPTQIKPFDISVSAGGNYTLNYSNPQAVRGGGQDGSTAQITTTPNGHVTVPTVTDVAVAGIISTPGLLVVTEFYPTAKGNYLGYHNVAKVIQVWASDTAMLNGGSLDFSGQFTSPEYVAIQWGGNFYPHAAPSTGYAFNGGSINAPNGGLLGEAPFTDAQYANGVLTIGPIPTNPAKGDGTFEVILSVGNQDLPVELSSFTATSASSQLLVNLQWTTESETNNLGYNVLRAKDSNIANAINLNVSIIQGTNSSNSHTYHFADDTVEEANNYYYWLENIDISGYSNINGPILVQVLEQGNPGTPPLIPTEVTVLNSAYPNPFNPVTNISFELKTSEFVNITIYDVKGQKIKTLTAREWNAGRHHLVWNGTNENSHPVGSGVYFYRMIAGKFHATQKMVLLK